MTKFIVKSRSDIEAGFFPGGNAVLISISDTGSQPPICNEQYIAQSAYSFDDADVQANPSVRLISTADAMNILNFVDGYMLNDLDYVVVNCEAGMSRSAGCAAALSKIHNGDDNCIIKIKPMYNRKVYSEILNYHFN